jgi:CRP-like cAMP-binding protein
MATEILEGYEIFRFLRPDQVKELSDTAETISLQTGETVYQRGEKARHFFVVQSGQVSLRLPGPEGVSILIDQLNQGAVFGSCICLDIDSYSATAQCNGSSQLLKIDASALKHMMEDDLRAGYAIQTYISKTYFKRYIDTMSKLQAIIMNIPLATG